MEPRCRGWKHSKSDLSNFFQLEFYKRPPSRSWKRSNAQTPRLLQGACYALPVSPKHRMLPACQRDVGLRGCFPVCDPRLLPLVFTHQQRKRVRRLQVAAVCLDPEGSRWGGPLPAVLIKERPRVEVSEGGGDHVEDLMMVLPQMKVQHILAPLLWVEKHWRTLEIKT